MATPRLPGYTLMKCVRATDGDYYKENDLLWFVDGIVAKARERGWQEENPRNHIGDPDITPPKNEADLASWKQDWTILDINEL